jgi:hypothetical protein
MQRRRMFRLVPLLLIVSALALAPACAYASPSGVPRIGHRHGTSTNWSGYAVETNLASPQANAVSDVVGTWTVTPVTATPMNAYAATWLGIDGYSSGTVEQLGTEEDWYNGSAVYYAWYEMYPKSSHTITSMVIHPADVMSAEVKYTGKNTFVLTLRDVTRGTSFSTTQKATAKRTSAEWIVEAPWSGGVLPLADFGTQTFTSCAATLGGHSGAISDTRWQYDRITMVNASNVTKASVGGLTAGGTSFTDTWVAAN